MAETVVLTVRLSADALEVMTFHNALETLALGDAGNVDPLELTLGAVRY